MPPLVEMKDVYKIYHMGDTEVHALDGISLTINKGEFVAIVGQSGSGKSTCMNIIGCLDVATKGVYRLNGREINNYSQDELADVRNNLLCSLDASRVRERLNICNPTVHVLAHFSLDFQ